MTNLYFSKRSFSTCNPFSETKKNCIACIDCKQRINYYVVKETTINRFQCYRRSIGVIDLVADDPDVPETTIGCRSKLDGVGTGPDCIVPDQDIVTKCLCIMGL